LFSHLFFEFMYLFPLLQKNVPPRSVFILEVSSLHNISWTHNTLEVSGDLKVLASRKNIIYARSHPKIH
jgi:hypothetical protein